MHKELRRVADMVRSEERVLTQSDLINLRDYSHQMVAQMDLMDRRMFEREQKQESEAASEEDC